MAPMLSHSETQHNHKRKQGQIPLPNQEDHGEGRSRRQPDGRSRQQQIPRCRPACSLMNQHYGGENLQRFAKGRRHRHRHRAAHQQSNRPASGSMCWTKYPRASTSAWQLLVPADPTTSPPCARFPTERIYDRIMLAAKTYAGEPDPPPLIGATHAHAGTYHRAQRAMACWHSVV